MITSSAVAFVLTAVIGVVGVVVVGATPPAVVAVPGAVGRVPGGGGNVGSVGSDGRTTFVAEGRKVVGPVPTRFVVAVVVVVVVVVTAPVAVAAAGLVAATARFVAGGAKFVAPAVRLVTLGTRASVVAGAPRKGASVAGGATLVDSVRMVRCGTGTIPRFVFVVCAQALAASAAVVNNVKVFIFTFAN